MKKTIRIALFTVILAILSMIPCYASSVTDAAIMQDNQNAVSDPIANPLDPMAAIDPVNNPQENPVTIGYIFVGDSRLDGLVLYTDFNKVPDIFTISGTSRGYKYLVNNVDKQIAKIKANNPEILIWYEVYALGINDIGNANKYYKWYADRALTNNVILVSVNPLEHHKYITNADIEKFNIGLQELNLPYINSYDHLNKIGFTTWDGTHYSKETCKNIASYFRTSARAIGNKILYNGTY